MFFVRLCSALLSAFIVIRIVPGPAFVFWRISSCAEHWTEACHDDFIWHSEWGPPFKLFAGGLWIFTWLILEIASRIRPQRPKRLLTHLRYGPVAIVLLSIVVILVSDQVLTQFSRWHIVHYIYSDATPLERPELNLYDNYRGWCGNGRSAHEYAVYGSTPAEYFDHPDAAVRARALQASIYVYDWLNNPGDGPAIEVLRKAANDPDVMVRRIAAEYQSELGISSHADPTAVLEK